MFLYYKNLARGTLEPNTTHAMARPVKSESDRRTHLVQARLSPAELAGVMARVSASGVSLSTFARLALTGAPVSAPASARTDAKAVFQLERIGANLNQLTARAHSLGLSLADRAALMETVEDIRRAVARLDPDGA
jgi:Bacterial mobilisation protein (MobC)